MTRDEIRGLMGGYATGSLSEAERNALFNAALEDQELFDELAREDALKAAIDQPGARERLLGALQPKPRFNSLWIWATAAAAAAAVVVIGAVLIRSPREPQQIAKVETPPVLQPKPEPETVAKPRLQMKRKVAPVPTPEPVPEQTEAAKKSDADIAQAPPVPAPAVIGGVAPTGLAGARGGGVGGGGGGGRGGRAVPQSLAAPMAAAPLPPPPARFAFDYSVTPEGAFNFTARGNGFLSVEANNGREIVQVVGNRPVSPGMAIDVALPADAVSVTAIFSARPMSSDRSLLTSVDPPSGTKTDPNPSPNSILVAMIPLKP